MPIAYEVTFFLIIMGYFLPYLFYLNLIFSSILISLSFLPVTIARSVAHMYVKLILQKCTHFRY